MDAAFEDETFETGELIIPPHSPLAGKRLSEARIRDHAEALVITVVKHDGTRIFNPSGSLVVEPGDELLFIGTRGTRDRVSNLVHPPND
jgi:voltage-gated potassium channel